MLRTNELYANLRNFVRNCRRNAEKQEKRNDKKPK